MQFKTLIVERKGAYATIIINRPEKLNALSEEVFFELREVLVKLDVRGLLLTGVGEKAFVAGADIKAMNQMTTDQGEAFAKLAQETTELIEGLPYPVIACINGYALGGGCELAMACDFIYATQISVFGQPEVSLGLIPGFGGCVRLPRYIGLGRAKEMIYTGRQISALEAQNMGLVNTVFPTKTMMFDAAMETLKEIATKYPGAVANSKRVINTALGKTTKDALLIERQGFREAFESDEKRKGVYAFLAKRS